MVMITAYRRDLILEAVQAMYAAVATSPWKEFHFPTGRAACEFVGYPAEQLDALPAGAVESFAGVGYPFAAALIRPGDVVLDVGSGSGTDALIASRLTGVRGRVMGLDMTAAMREKLRANAVAAGSANVEILDGDAEEIPLPDASVDVVTSNGVLNLVPDKSKAIAEIARVLRPDGRVQIADIVLGTPPPAKCLADPELWAECIVGATTEADYLDHFERVDFTGIETLSHFDYFSKSASAETRAVAASFGAVAIVMRARKLGAAAWAGPHRAASSSRPERGLASPAAAARPPEVPPSAGVPAPTRLAVGSIRADRRIDTGARGCGEMAPLVRGALRELTAGQVLAVHSEVPMAGPDLASWCRLAGHEFLGSGEMEETSVHYIRKKRG